MITIFSFLIKNIELVAAICGGIIALFQWKESNTNKRVEYLNSLLERLWNNKDIQEFILLNDYNKDWYNEAFHRSDDKTLPTQADKTLSFMNYICYVVNVKVIRCKEKGLFDYYLSTLAKCDDMRKYIFDLYQYSILNDKPYLFTYFLDVCVKENLLPKGIKDKNFFKYIMLEESNKNKGLLYKLPAEIQEVKDEICDELFLKTCSRCEHCKKFISGKCSASQEMENYYWLPLNQNNHCEKFDFKGGMLEILVNRINIRNVVSFYLL